MKSKAIVLILAIAAVAASPVLVQATTHVFDHPSSLPTQASDNARKALAARGTHGHEGNETGDHDHDENETATGDHEHDDNETESGEHEAADVENSHDVNPGENTTVTNCIENEQVIVYVQTQVTPGTGAADTTQSIQHGGIMAQPLGGTLEASC